MLDLCGGLFVLLLVLSVVTLIGHGIWVMLAAMFNSSRGQAQGRGSDANRPRESEWTIAANQLYRLRERGLLSEVKYDAIIDVLREERAERRTEFERASGIVTDAEPPPIVEPPSEEQAVEVIEFEEVQEDQPAAPAEAEPPAVKQRTLAERKATQEPRPKRDLGGILQAFMEEKNIRWGELVSGMLIVGSAIGLVISLWSTLQQTIPYFPALLFMLGTAAIHGAGLYTLKRWNLKSTSRGLLLISTLLIPLNFLAAIALSGEPGSPNYVSASDPIYFLAVGVGLFCYGAIAYSAGRVFRKHYWWVLWSAVMIPAIGQLVIARQAMPDLATVWINLLAAIPLAGFAVAIAAQLQLAARGRFSRRRAEQTFQTLGVGAFSLLMALGLLIARTTEGWHTLAQLSPIVSLLSVLVTATGVIVHVRATRDALAGHRTAGTAISFTGSALMLAGLVLAWPQPDLLIAVGIVDAIALTGLAISARLPALHIPAVAAMSLMIVIGLHWSQDVISIGANGVQLVDAFLMGRSSLMYLGLAVAAAGASFVWSDRGRKAEGTAYLWSAAGLAGLSLCVALLAGFVTEIEAHLTTPVFFVAAIGAFVFGQRVRQPWGVWTGAALSFLAFLHATVLNEPVVNFLTQYGMIPRDPAILAGLLTATIATALGGVDLWRIRRDGAEADSRRLEVNRHFCTAGFTFAGLCLPVIVFGHFGAYAIHAGYLFWVASLWGVTAVALRSRELLVPAQGVSFVGIGFLATLLAQRMPWWDANFADPRYWQVLLCGLAGWCIVWAAARRFAPTDSPAAVLLGRREFNVDHAVLAGTGFGAIVLAVIGVLPGISAELQLNAVMNTGFAEFAPQPPDIFVGIGILALSVATLIAVGCSTLRQYAATWILAVLATILIVSTQLKRVTAESFELAAGVSHSVAYGVGTWVLFGLVVVGVLMTLWERLTTAALCGLVLLGGLVPLLISGQLEQTVFTATALRFGLVGYALLLTMCFVFREQLSRGRQRLERRLPEANTDRHLAAMKATGMAATLWPILAFTLYAALFAAGGNAIAGTTAVAIFGQVDVGLSYAIPLGLFAALVALGAEFRDGEDWNSRDGSYLSASMLIQLGMVLLFALPHWLWDGNLRGPGLAALLQWSGVGLGACTLLWIARQFAERTAKSLPGGEADLESRIAIASPFGIQLCWTAATVGLLSLWAAFAIMVSPTEFLAEIAQLGHPLGFVAFGLALAGLVMSRRWLPSDWKADGVAITGVLVAPLIAAAASVFGAGLEIDDSWLAYHALIAGWGIVAVGLTALSVLRRREDAFATKLMIRATTLAGLLVVLGWRAQWADPQRPWWFLGTATFAAALCAVFGIVRRKRSFAYASGGLALLATVAALSKPWIGLAAAPELDTYLDTFLTLLITTAGVGLFWLAVDLYWQRWRGESLDTQCETPPVHHTAAGLSVLFAAAYGLIAVSVRENAITEMAARLPLLFSPLGAGVLISGIGLLLASLWDRRAMHAIPGLYVMGLVVGIAQLDAANAGIVHPRLRIDADDLWLALGFIAATYVAITAGLWSARKPIAETCRRLKMPAEIVERSGTGAWLPWADLALAVFTTIIGFWAVLWFKQEDLRYAAGMGTLILAPALALFGIEAREPRTEEQSRAAAFQLLALLTTVVAAVQLVWAIPMDASGDAASLQLAIRLLEVLSVATLVYAAAVSGLFKSEAGWGRAMRTASIFVGGLALAALFAVLLMEATLFEPKQVPISNLEIAIVSVILVGLAGGLILLAVVPSRDPLRMSERGRTIYVYAAEVVVSLLFLHIYLTKPRLFQGLLRPYWPYIVIGIAFAGVGLSEWFRRKKLRVLAEPLERTGTFLPALPLLAFWTIASEQRFDKYSLVLLLAGLVYVMLASLRKSFVYSLLAAVLANLALWSMFHHVGIALLSRPQLWLIPPALSLLAAAQLNRGRLSDAQLTAIRYFSMLAIYASSTGEMFIHSAADPHNFWHPMLLAGLSVAGILCGMLMRVRAFLYLGTTFLFLSLVSMVWHAARAIDEVWPWWVFGIVTGIAMLALFGLFEKKRDEVLGTFKRLKEWDA